MIRANESSRLYLITPPRFVPNKFLERLKSVLDAGPITCLQIRLKNADDDSIKRTIEILIPLCHKYSVPVILNDRPDLAKLAGCDGVHVGQNDMPYVQARKIMGPDAIIGVTCKSSRHLAIEAADKGADYVAFGAFFATKTKQATTPATLDILNWWNEISTVPSVAIGGISTRNYRSVIEAGADYFAVVDGVWNYIHGEANAVKAFNKLVAVQKD